MFERSSFDVAAVVAFAMKGAAWAFSAVSTAGFLYSFGGALFSFLFPSPIAEGLAAAAGVLFVEIPCLTWPLLRLQRAGNENQRKIAEVMTWISVAAALVLTTAFFVLTFGAVDVSAAVATWAGIIGSVATVAAFVLNFGAWSLFQRMDNAFALQAELQDMQGDIERRAFGQIMVQTAQNVDGLIADAVNAQTEKAREAILYAIGGPAAAARYAGHLEPGRPPAPATANHAAPVDDDPPAPEGAAPSPLAIAGAQRPNLRAHANGTGTP